MIPSLAIAGLHGDSGKTLVSLGLIASWMAKGKSVSPFKKGPDYIDAAWLSLAAKCPCHNLDTFLMGSDWIQQSWRRGSEHHDFAVLEGNRGLFDGLDAQGSHSTASLCKLLACPVLLVIDVTKMTRTAAALVKGVQAMDAEVDLLGVVLNRIGGSRHEQMVREAIETSTGLPVLGAIPKLDDRNLIPGRHLGLVTTAEHPKAQQAIDTAKDIISEYLDIPTIETLARQRSQRISGFRETIDDQESAPSGRSARVRVGVIRDSAFPFYYPENLEALERRGADLVWVSVLRDLGLPDNLDALYIGGGFPETHAERLAQNSGFLRSLKEAADDGLPIYAECGGLMLLAQSLEFQGVHYPLAGILPFDIVWSEKPEGHGYICGVIDAPNPFYPVGLEIKGHEFHYSRILQPSRDWESFTAVSLSRGKGIGGGRDGYVQGQVFAAYTHVHASSLPQWADGMIKAAQKFK